MFNCLKINTIISYNKNYSALIPNIKPICLNKYNNIEECKKIINIVNNLNFSNNISANLDISNTNINIEISSILLNDITKYNNSKQIFINIETDNNFKNNSTNINKNSIDCDMHKLTKKNAIIKKYIEENAMLKQYIEENAMLKQYIEENAMLIKNIEENAIIQEHHEYVIIISSWLALIYISIYLMH